MSNETQAKRTPEEFAANYPSALQDGFHGPVTMGNIGTHEGRIIYNVNMKTVKSGAKGASFSTPIDWGQKFNTGDQVNVIVENGYVKKAFLARPSALTSAVNKKIQEKADEASVTQEEIAEAQEAVEAPALALVAEEAEAAAKPF